VSTTSELRVRYAETDQMGVVYHANYLVWCEIGRTDFIREHGTSYAEMERQGISLAVAEASLRLHASARYDDVVRVETSLVNVKSRLITFDYVITRAADGVRLASARTSLVSLAPDGRPAALPSDVRARLEAFAA
jgi:acyl-CoA thioester hydrolase